MTRVNIQDLIVAQTLTRREANELVGGHHCVPCYVRPEYPPCYYPARPFYPSCIYGPACYGPLYLS